jgi:valyl-tRNA synthetase
MGLLQAVISAARTIRSEHDIDKKIDVPLLVRSANPQVLSFLRGHAEAVRLLVKTKGDPQFEAPGETREPGTTVAVVPSAHGPIEVLVTLKGLVDPGEERARIARELKKLEKELAAIDKKLGAPGFIDRAPKEVVDEANAQRRALIDAIERLQGARRLADEL